MEVPFDCEWIDQRGRSCQAPPGRIHSAGTKLIWRWRPRNVSVWNWQLKDFWWSLDTIIQSMYNVFELWKISIHHIDHSSDHKCVQHDKGCISLIDKVEIDWRSSTWQSSITASPKLMACVCWIFERSEGKSLLGIEHFHHLFSWIYISANTMSSLILSNCVRKSQPGTPTMTRFVSAEMDTHWRDSQVFKVTISSIKCCDIYGLAGCWARFLECEHQLLGLETNSSIQSPLKLTISFILKAESKTSVYSHLRLISASCILPLSARESTNQCRGCRSYPWTTSQDLVIFKGVLQARFNAFAESVFAQMCAMNLTLFTTHRLSRTTSTLTSRYNSRKIKNTISEMLWNLEYLTINNQLSCISPSKIVIDCIQACRVLPTPQKIKLCQAWSRTLPTQSYFSPGTAYLGILVEDYLNCFSHVDSFSFSFTVSSCWFPLSTWSDL